MGQGLGCCKRRGEYVVSNNASPEVVRNGHQNSYVRSPAAKDGMPTPVANGALRDQENAEIKDRTKFQNGGAEQNHDCKDVNSIENMVNQDKEIESENIKKGNGGEIGYIPYKETGSGSENAHYEKVEQEETGAELKDGEDEGLTTGGAKHEEGGKEVAGEGEGEGGVDEVDNKEDGEVKEEEKDGGGEDPADVAAKSEDRFYNNKAFQQPDVDPSDPEQQDAALTIQTKYRQHHAKQVVEDKREDAAATKIQAGFRGMQDRSKVKDMQKNQDDASQKADSEANLEEEVDIDLEDPEVAAAAAKIQAGFKGYKVRQEVKAKKDQEKGDEPASEQPAEGEKTEQPEEDIDLNDPEVQAAATKIQAGFKGMKARQDMKAKQEAEPSQSEQPAETDQSEPPKQEEEEVDIDLNDPEVQAAATKIQAGFKGMQARKKVAEKKEEEEKPADDKKAEEEEVDIDLNDPEVAAAAIKIQAGFKGYKARKGMTEKKEGESGETGEGGEKKDESEEKKEGESEEKKEEEVEKVDDGEKKEEEKGE